jgi:hypothetical protein
MARLLDRIQEELPTMAFKSIKHARRIIHNPAELIEGRPTLHTTAKPSVSGMSEDNIEIDVRLNAPDGNRIPPKGPNRGKRKGKKKPAPPSPTALVALPKPTQSAAQNKLAQNIAAFAMDGPSEKPSN